MKSLPLTATTGKINLDLSGNRLTESKVVDIGFMLKHYRGLKSLEIDFKDNHLGRSSIEMLMLSLGYLD